MTPSKEDGSKEISGRSLDRKKKLIIMQDAAISMEYLHMKNIIHFDLKCENLLVNLGDPQRPVCKVMRSKLYAKAS